MAPTSIAWAVALVSLVVTIATWRLAARHDATDARHAFETRSDEIRDQLAERLETYRTVLRGVAGVLDASDHVTRAEFAHYVDRLRLDETHPGLHGIGYAPRVASDQLQRHLRAVRTEMPQYAIWPAGERAEYFPVLYREPAAGELARAMGFDMRSESARRAAMETARDANTLTLSARTDLLSQEDSGIGAYLMVPLFQRGMPIESVPQRRAALRGYAYGAFRVPRLIEQVVGKRLNDAALEVYDGTTIDEAALMYRSSQAARAPAFTTTRRLQFAQHTWTLRMASLPFFERAQSSLLAPLVLGSGIAVTLLLALLTYRGGVLQRTAERAERVAGEKIEAIQRLRMITDNVPALIAYIDKNERIQFSNKAVAALYAESGVEGRTVREVLGEERYGDAGRDLRAAFAGRELSYERSAVGKDGVVRHYLVHHLPHRDATGDIVGVFSLGIDLGDLRKAEAELRHAYGALQEANAELEVRNREYANLRELGSLLQACQTLEEAFPVVARFEGKLNPPTPGVLYVAIDGDGTLQAMARWSNPCAATENFPPDDCWAVRRARRHTVDHAQHGPLCRHLTEPPPEGYLCVPLLAQGEVQAVLHLQYPLRRAKQTDDEYARERRSVERWADIVADSLALELASLKLRDKLRQQAIRDALTGLYNRRYLDLALPREMQRASRRGQPLTIMLFDIDHFKRYNDTQGHEGGDALLKALGAFIATQVRAEDIACRHGGEEFIVVLPETTLAQAIALAERLRRSAAEVTVEMGGRLLPSVTLSMGVAAFPDHGNSMHALISAADAALYRAKGNGRNRVEAAVRAVRPTESDSAAAQRKGHT